MFQALIAILAVSGIASGLAGLLVLAERLLGDHGVHGITVNADRRLEAPGGVSLLEALAANGVFVPSACGGRGTCAYCKVRVTHGGGPLLPTELPYLTAAERAEGVRLSCQVRVRGDMSVRLPESMLRVREYAARCERITVLTEDTREFRFRLEEPAEIRYTPGQYVQLLAPAYDGNEEVYRAYSIASDPRETGLVDLIIRLVPGGICTTWCFERLRRGDRVRLNGPHGDFRLSDRDPPAVFVAGGSGMAPMKCILHDLRNRKATRRVTYFFGANRVADLFFLDLMAGFEKDLPGFEFVPVVAEPGRHETWSGETGLVTEALDRRAGDLSGREAYLCGSPGMIDAAIAVLVRHGLPGDRIYYDKFA